MTLTFNKIMKKNLFGNEYSPYMVCLDNSIFRYNTRNIFIQGGEYLNYKKRRIF